MRSILITIRPLVIALPAVRAAISPNGRPTVLVAEKLGAGGVEMLKEVADVKTALNMSKEELLETVSQADAIVIRSATKVGSCRCLCISTLLSLVSMCYRARRTCRTAIEDAVSAS